LQLQNFCQFPSNTIFLVNSKEHSPIVKNRQTQLSLKYINVFQVEINVLFIDFRTATKVCSADGKWTKGDPVCGEFLILFY
jgi:hypothetical protein